MKINRSYKNLLDCNRRPNYYTRVLVGEEKEGRAINGLEEKKYRAPPKFGKRHKPIVKIQEIFR